jgi:hypothetical protein
VPARFISYDYRLVAFPGPGDLDSINRIVDFETRFPAYQTLMSPVEILILNKPPPAKKVSISKQSPGSRKSYMAVERYFCFLEATGGVLRRSCVLGPMSDLCWPHMSAVKMQAAGDTCQLCKRGLTVVAASYLLSCVELCRRGLPLPFDRDLAPLALAFAGTAALSVLRVAK